MRCPIKSMWSNLDHYSYAGNRVPSLSQSLLSCLGTSMMEVSFIFLTYIFSLHSSDCQILFLGLSSLPDYYKTLR